MRKIAIAVLLSMQITSIGYAAQDSTEKLSDDVGGWQKISNQDPITDKTTYGATLKATRGRGWLGDLVELTVRCRENQTLLIINWKSIISGDGADVIYRFGKNDPDKGKWYVMGGGVYTVTPNMDVINGIVENKSFIVQTTTYDDEIVTAVFDTTGAKSALSDVRKSCNW